LFYTHTKRSSTNTSSVTRPAPAIPVITHRDSAGAQTYLQPRFHLDKKRHFGEVSWKFTVIEVHAGCATRISILRVVQEVEQGLFGTLNVTRRSGARGR